MAASQRRRGDEVALDARAQFAIRPSSWHSSRCKARVPRREGSRQTSLHGSQAAEGRRASVAARHCEGDAQYTSCRPPRPARRTLGPRPGRSTSLGSRASRLKARRPPLDRIAIEERTVTAGSRADADSRPRPPVRSRPSGPLLRAGEDATLPAAPWLGLDEAR